MTTPMPPIRGHIQITHDRCSRCTWMRAIHPSHPSAPPGRLICPGCLDCVNCKRNHKAHDENGKCLFAPTHWDSGFAARESHEDAGSR
jgi:hypothetical protein